MICGTLNPSCCSAAYAERLQVEGIMRGMRNVGTLQMALLLLPKS